tara:strand:- start:2628 stop:2909 length:282 start_codon:yes stop_codon:yes gene_type:complete
MKLPNPPTRPDLVDSYWVHHMVKVLEDDRWIVRDRYSYGHPVVRSVIDKSKHRNHPKFEVIVKHPDEEKPSAWILLPVVLWAAFWVYLNNLYL